MKTGRGGGPGGSNQHPSGITRGGRVSRPPLENLGGNFGRGKWEGRGKKRKGKRGARENGGKLKIGRRKGIKMNRGPLDLFGGFWVFFFFFLLLTFLNH